MMDATQEHESELHLSTSESDRHEETDDDIDSDGGATAGEAGTQLETTWQPQVGMVFDSADDAKARLCGWAADEGHVLHQKYSKAFYCQYATPRYGNKWKQERNAKIAPEKKRPTKTPKVIHKMVTQRPYAESK